jgi:NTP pyrophosphatase (non-canonical NTP hydrolase)
MTPYQNELLLIAMEECAEVVQAISKVKRFGADTKYYYDPEFTNLDIVVNELGDTLAMIRLLIDSGLIHEDDLEIAKRKKLDKVKLWMVNKGE